MGKDGFQMPEEFRPLLKWVHLSRPRKQSEQEDTVRRFIRENPSETALFCAEIDDLRSGVSKWGNELLRQHGNQFGNVISAADRHPYSQFVALINLRDLFAELDGSVQELTPAAAARDYEQQNQILFGDATVAADRAFSEKDYKTVVARLTPFQSQLTKAQQMKLRLATERTSKTQ